MKNTLAALLLLLSFHSFSQVPDSLNVELPWQVVYFSSCDASSGEGPMTENENVQIYLDSEKLIEDTYGECYKKLITWAIIDWHAGEIYQYVQIGKVSDDAVQCQNDIYMHYDDFPTTLEPGDLVSNYDPSHEYSYKYFDNTVNSYVVDENSASNIEFYVYDFTNNSVCKTSVYVTSCEDDVSITVPESGEVIFNQEPFIPLTLEMLGVEIIYPCDSYTTQIKVGNTNSNLLPSSYVGHNAKVKVEIHLGDGNKYVKTINVAVNGIKPDPITMYIEDKSFSAGETVELEIWSDEILGLVAWQFQLQFANTEVLDLVKGELFDEIPFNIIEEGPRVRALWFPANGLPLNVESDATWFTLVVKPDFDGSTFDIFQTAQDPWSLIAIEDMNYIAEYEAEFNFNIEPRAFLSVEDDFTFNTVDVFPNPSYDNINIQGVSNPNSPLKVEVYNLEGKLMLKEEFIAHNSIFTLDISGLPTGMFILKTQNENVLSSHKISKI